MVGFEPRDESSRSEAGHIAIKMAVRERRFLDFVEFLAAFIRELNDLAGDGAAVLVEGKRDRDALVGLGYGGPILTKASLHSERGVARLKRVSLVVVLTDLDGEGRRLAARYADFFERRGIDVSLTQRRRLLKASHGIFLHVENLVRFVPMVPEVLSMGAEN
jgi:5S rRNA maturation endonuclease (ribonuclease M5)